MKKNVFISVYLIFFSVSLFACSCPKIKGLNGKFAGFETMSNLLNHTLLIEVADKTNMGILVKIKNDYKNSTDLDELFIENLDSSLNCSHSTEKFKIGEKYLIVLWSDKKLKKKNSLSICYESFINVTSHQTEAQIIDRKGFQSKIWTIEEIEERLGIKIKN